MSQRQLVMVLGMGRSGTSALTRVLSLCGASLPETLLTADQANSAGYWEPTEALDLNEQFLLRHSVTGSIPPCAYSMKLRLIDTSVRISLRA